MTADAHGAPLVCGDIVRLLSKPDGCHSQFHPLTVGREYEVIDFIGSNVQTTTDEPDCVADYWRGRVQKMKSDRSQASERENDD